MNSSIGKEYLSTIISRLKYYKDLAERTFSQLEEKDFHFIPAEESNSISVIIQHMSGNMVSRFTNFLTEDGEKEWRHRDTEFFENSYSYKELLEVWEKGWTCFFDALNNLKEDDLIKTIYIRKEPISVIDAINRQLAHHSYHIGQIVYLGRLIKKDKWVSLSIPKGQSDNFNKSNSIKDPSRNFKNS